MDRDHDTDVIFKRNNTYNVVFIKYILLLTRNPLLTIPFINTCEITE